MHTIHQPLQQSQPKIKPNELQIRQAEHVCNVGEETTRSVVLIQTHATGFKLTK